MLDYNFRDLLSAYEFECFSRDLINAHEGLNLASFAEGRDGGIDLRCSSNKGGVVIVQAKRYINYSELKSSLKKEIEKVKRLNPTRYIITTSVDLTAANKTEIMDWFQPFIQNENDILAKQDLNKLLAQHPTIERQYYKLWLASTNVLASIFNKNIANWTLFEENEIRETVKTYVMNDSFGDALNKLIQNHYVIISGEPGIGKTTLARVLIMHLLSDKFNSKPSATDYEEFYCTNNNIEDLMRVYQTGRRQVFFYDDFLGQISLEEGERGFDKRLTSFIKACRSAEDKLFILTTREYILQQGLVRYPLFNTKGIEVSKCVVDMGKYTRFVRAQILYNHLVANETPQLYINELLKNKNYLKIIDHPHFSPRIIETFVENGTHESCEPGEYFKTVLGYFDHPDSVWLDAFKRLKDIAQEALLVLYTMPTPVLLDDWKEAYYFFFQEVHKETNYLKDQDWKDSVKMLLNNFIKTGKCPDGVFVEFHNPGVKEVLIRYVNDNESVRPLLLNHICYIDQVLGVLNDYRHSMRGTEIPIMLSRIILDAFDRCWDSYKSCKLTVYRLSRDKEFYRRNPLPKVDALYYLAIGFKVMMVEAPMFFIEQKISQELMADDSCDLSSQLSLLEKIDVSKTTLDIEALFKSYRERLYSSVDCMSFAESIEKVFPEQVDYLDSEEFCSMAAECLKQEFESAKESELEELDSTVKELCRHAPSIEYEPIVGEINKAYSDYYDYLEAQAEAYQDDYRYDYQGNIGEDAWEIDNLFATMKD